MSQPQYPLLFYKPSTALSGPFDPITVPPMAQEGTGLDYECELVIVIGKRCRDVSEPEALDCVLGYAVGNDVTHRDWQLKRGNGQWSHGKGFDTWAPFGPGIVTSSVITEPQDLKIWTKVNGEMLQVGGLNLCTGV
jgi:2-keto-4-pentenoate hydratase/2-oxohepta-3-ene-1,7-dioic acid hydratase in catechol pathway